MTKDHIAYSGEQRPLAKSQRNMMSFSKSTPIAPYMENRMEDEAKTFIAFIVCCTIIVLSMVGCQMNADTVNAQARAQCEKQ